MTQYSGVYTLQTQGQALTSGQWCTDPYYKNTTLLLHADGVAGGAQNNTFLDSSTNAFAITRNGNTTQGSFTPYGPTWSNYFDGSGDGVSIPDNAAIEIGASSFCVEGWIFPTSTSGTQCVFYKGASGVSTGYAPINISFSGTSLVCYASSNGSSWNVLSNQTIGTLTTNAWNHFVVCRSGSDWGFFLNGVRNSTASSSATLLDNSAAYSIGRSPGYSEDYNGYISNVRLVIGSSVYTPTQTSLIVPTVPLTNITNTAFLTCQSNRFIDNGTANSGSGFTVTVSGNTSVQRFSPFAPQYQYTPAVIGGSGYFDGTGDYLSVAGNTVFNMGSGDFTVEAWVYPQGSGNRRFVDYANGTASNSNFSFVLRATSSNTIYGAVYVGSTEYSITSTETFLNTWVHVALVRSGTGSNNLKLYVNGVSVGTPQSISTSSINTLTGTPYLSISSYYNGSGEVFNGYVNDVRITKGGALYTTTFTAPTAPLTTTVASGTVSLLTSMTNAGIYDNAMMNNLETVGNAQVSTSVVKYGSGSLAFDGSGDYLNSPVGNLNCDLSNGDFTVECWLNLNSVSGTQIVVARSAYNITTGAQVQYGIYASGSSLIVRPYQSTTDYSITVGTVTTGTWYHVALVRQGNTFSGFLNGVKSSTTQTISGALNNDAAWYGILLGNQQVSSANNYLNGYIDDLRITKGVARYTANFQPPKVAFANQ